MFWQVNKGAPAGVLMTRNEVYSRTRPDLMRITFIGHKACIKPSRMETSDPFSMGSISLLEQFLFPQSCLGVFLEFFSASQKYDLRCFLKITSLKHKGLWRASSLLWEGEEVGKPRGEYGKHYLVASNCLPSGAGKQYKVWHFVQ